MKNPYAKSFFTKKKKKIEITGFVKRCICVYKDEQVIKVNDAVLIVVEGSTVYP